MPVEGGEGYRVCMCVCVRGRERKEGRKVEEEGGEYLLLSCESIIERDTLQR